jgi:riboflavin synthase
MFTGIVQDVGRIAGREVRGGDMRLNIAVTKLALDTTNIGDSICVHGVCLTVVERSDKSFIADVSRETLTLTTLGALGVDSLVNLELALKAGDALGGHLVSGHVDGIGQVLSAEPDARSLRIRIRPPAELGRYIARKGSIALDGVSLTVNEVDDLAFGINLIPHTLQATTLGHLKPGTRVNLEVDQVARYVERLLGAGAGGYSPR